MTEFTTKLWDWRGELKPGQVVGIAFTNSSEVYSGVVESYVRDWCEFVNLRRDESGVRRRVYLDRDATVLAIARPSTVQDMVIDLHREFADTWQEVKARPEA